MVVYAQRECPECGLSLPAGARDCPCCGCAYGGTGLVDHLPPADADASLAPIAVAVAGLVAAEVALVVLAPVGAAVLAAACAVGLAAWALRGRAARGG